MLLGGWGRLGGQGFGGAWGAGLRWGVMAAVRRRSRTFSAAGATENSAMTVNLFSVLHLPAFAGVGGERAKRRFAGRKGQRGEAALRGTHSQAALGNDKGRQGFGGAWGRGGIIV